MHSAAGLRSCKRGVASQERKKSESLASDGGKILALKKCCGRRKWNLSAVVLERIEAVFEE
jgi:hypothetical protein